MLLSTILLAAFSSAFPSQELTLSIQDTSAVQLALYLENFGPAIFSYGCNNFTDADFTNAGFLPYFRGGLCVMAAQDNVHVTGLAHYLESNNGEVVPPCSYSFPNINDPMDFAYLALGATAVGVGYYTGALERLIDNPVLEVSFGSILTIHARHNAILRLAMQLDPFPTPYDTALSNVWAFNLARPYTVTCAVTPGLVTLPPLSLPSATLPNHPAFTPGSQLDFAWDSGTFLVTVDPSTPLYIAMVSQEDLDPIYLEVTTASPTGGTITLPILGLAGTVFACLTTFSGGLDLDDLTSYGTLAGPVAILFS